MTLIWPILRTYGQLGNIPGERMVQLTNEVILNFWDVYLKKLPDRQIVRNDDPELEVEISLQAARGSAASIDH